jgi:hypothetical protein
MITMTNKTTNMRTRNYIVTIPMKSEEQVIEIKKALEQIFGWVVLRGRHSDRKSVVTNYRKWAQNDVPWRKAEYIDVYLHPKNVNYNSTKGIHRQNRQYNNSNVVNARIMGNLKMSFADGYYNAIQSKSKTPYQAIINQYYAQKRAAIVTGTPKTSTI